MIERDFPNERKAKSEKIIKKFNSKELFMERDEIFGLVEKMLQNTRDVLQFYNSIKGHLVKLNDEVDLEDLILLELLKVYSFRTYNSLSLQDESLLVVKKGSYQLVKDKAEVKDEAEFKDDNEDLIKKVLNLLIAEEGKAIGMFCKVINHYLYFSYTLPENMISRKEFMGLLNGTDDVFLDKVSNWLDNQKDDFIGAFWKVDNFKSDEKTYGKYLKTMLRFKKDLGVHSGSLETELAKFEETAKELKIKNPQDFIYNILKDKRLTAAERLRFAGTFQRFKLNHNVGDFLKSLVLLSIMEPLFEKFLDEFNPDDDNALSFLFYMREPDGRGLIKFHEESCPVYKSFLEKNLKGLGQYVTELIVADKIINFDDVYIKNYPFSEIFPNAQDFLALLIERFSDEKAENWRKVIKKIPRAKFAEEKIASPGDDVYVELTELYLERERQHMEVGMSEFMSNSSKSKKE